MKARLKVDLTKYHTSLTMGAEGEVIGLYGRLSRDNPKAWVGVKFPLHTLDVLKDHIEFIKEEVKKPTGPQILITLDSPPLRGMRVDIKGIIFKIVSIEEKVDDISWLVNLELYQEELLDLVSQ